MNHTQNYRLPQWEESDRIKMDDFNQMCADIEVGLTEAKETAGVAYKPGQLPYTVGTYNGRQTAAVTVSLGFQPSGLMIWSQETATMLDSTGVSGSGLGVSGQITAAIQIQVIADVLGPTADTGAVNGVGDVLMDVGFLVGLAVHYRGGQPGAVDGVELAGDHFGLVGLGLAVDDSVVNDVADLQPVTSI